MTTALERPYDLTVIETMPEQHRDAHRAAGNFGHWPHNGSVRSIVLRDEAEQNIAADPDGYAWIVRAATVADVLASQGFGVGAEVEGGLPGTEDYDTGHVTYVLGPRHVEVAWDSGVKTRTEISALRVRS